MTNRNRGVKLADAGDLLAAHTSDNMRDRVLAFIIQYQDQHTGNTPTIDLIARQLNSVPQAVRAMIARLETARKIHVISRNPLRIVVMQRDTVLPHEQGSETAIHDPKRFDRLLEADGTRHGLARWIGQHNEAFGRGPTLREAMTYLNLTNGGWVNRQLEILGERGLIQYGAGKNTELTESGRIFYRVAPTKPAPVVVVPIKPQQEDEVMAEQDRKRETYQEALARRLDAPSSSAWADIAGRFIYQYQTTHGGASPEYKDIREALRLRNDTTIAVALAVLERDGLIQPRAKASKRNVFLTDAGKARFAPLGSNVQPVEKPVDQPPSYTPPPPVDLPPPMAKPKPVVEATRPRTYGDEIRDAMGRNPPPTPMEWFREEPTNKAILSGIGTPDLIMELIERGYVVRK